MVREVRPSGLASVCRPSVTRICTPKVRPLAQIGLSQDDRPGLSQFGSHAAISGHDCAEERIRASIVLHLIGGGDIVFDQDGYAVQGAALCPIFALGVELGRDGERIWVDLDHSMHGIVYLEDAGNVRLRFSVFQNQEQTKEGENTDRII